MYRWVLHSVSVTVTLYVLYRAFYDDQFVKPTVHALCTLHALSILQHVSTHHTFHRQGVFVVIIMMLSNGPLYDKWNNSPAHIPECFDTNCEDSLMLTRVARRNMLEN
jgi:hypothetical protein